MKLPFIAGLLLLASNSFGQIGSAGSVTNINYIFGSSGTLNNLVVTGGLTVDTITATGGITAGSGTYTTALTVAGNNVAQVQATTPGTQQSGHINISGTVLNSSQTISWSDGSNGYTIPHFVLANTSGGNGNGSVRSYVNDSGAGGMTTYNGVSTTNSDPNPTTTMTSDSTTRFQESDDHFMNTTAVGTHYIVGFAGPGIAAKTTAYFEITGAGVVSLSSGTTGPTATVNTTGVGILTTSPATPLDVNGAATIRGATTVSGSSMTVVSGNAGGTPGATFSPNLSSSTVSSALSGTFTTTTLGPCIANSTQTLTLPTNVSQISVSFNGTMSDGNLSAVIIAGILVDGAFYSGETTAKGFVAVAEPVISNGVNMSFTRVLTGLSSALHNICLTASVSAGTGTIDSTNSDAHFSAVMLP